MKAKKILALLLACAIMLGLAACGGNGGNAGNNNGGNTGNNGNNGGNVEVKIPDYINTESQMPIVKEGTDITLDVMIVNGPMYANMDSIRDVYFTQAYEKKTGVKIN